MASNRGGNNLKKASRFSTIILGLCFITMLGFKTFGQQVVGENSLFFCAAFALNSIVAGYISFLYSKMSKAEKKKSNWCVNRAFDVHPYFTFILSLILTFECFWQTQIR